MITKQLAAAVVTAALLVTTGCSGNTGNSTTSTTDSNAPVTLTMLAATYSDNTKTLWDGFISAFHAQHPNITINLEMQAWANINDVIKTKIQANQAPDILSIDAFSSYVEDDLLYSADQILSPSTIADFQPTFVQNATMNGKQYGFPLIASARALFINDDIFTKAGLDPTKPPKTWDDLQADAAAIKAVGDGNYGYCMPLGNEEAQAELAMWLLGNGGNYGDATTLTINSDADVQAVTFMKSLIDQGLTEPNPGSTQRTPMINNLFMQGKCGMAVGLPPFIAMFKQNAPNLHYSITPMPTKTGSPATLGVADHLMAFNNGDTAKGKAAGAFIDFFFQPTNYVKFVDTEGFLPTTKSGAAATTHTEFKIFNDLLPDASFYPSTNPKWGTMQGLIQQQIGTIGQGADPKTVLDNIQKSTDAGI
ncbi:MAG: extracellular solute-binding protein [Propionibacteriaceae bacterium]|nr:extracellular solute-binding protein [Propionibacteriaceae bacterium]